MSRTVVDGNGRLLDFAAVTRASDPDLAPPVGPEVVFRAARLDMAAFTETTPLRVPATPFDQWRAWKGPHPHFPDTQLQVEAAWWKGRVVSALVLYPWDQRPAAPPTAQATGMRDVWFSVMIAIAAFFAILMARRNWMRGRADRVGAFHVALASFLLQAVAWAGSFHPVADMAMRDLFVEAVAEWLMWAAVLWFAYLALEPEVRARWPHSIVTWNRVLAGRWLDAQVGSHVLIGAAVGSGLWAFFKAVTVYVFKNSEPSSWDVSLRALLGARHWIGAQAGYANGALSTGLFVFLTIFGMRQLLRSEWLAALGAAALFTLAQDEVAGPDWWVVGLLYLVATAALIFVLLRYGLVATIAAAFFIDAVNAMALGTDWSGWYMPASIATLVLLVGISLFAFWRSLGGRELIEADAG
jgi:serine/threonine-protein kinase